MINAPENAATKTMTAAVDKDISDLVIEENFIFGVLVFWCFGVSYAYLEYIMVFPYIQTNYMPNSIYCRPPPYPVILTTGSTEYFEESLYYPVGRT